MTALPAATLHRLWSPAVAWCALFCCAPVLAQVAGQTRAEYQNEIDQKDSQVKQANKAKASAEQREREARDKADKAQKEADQAKADAARLKAKLAALEAAASAPTAPAPSPLAALPTKAAMLKDGQELSVAGCGAACPSFVVLPQVGAVTMGLGKEERRVDFKYRLAMGKTEVTVRQWRHFMTDSGYKLAPNDTTHCDWQKEAVSEQHPVRCVSAEDADAYAGWFNKKYGQQLGHVVREVTLPTEEEWEYGARAGRWTQERQWEGGKEDCSMAGSVSCTGNTPDPVAKLGRKANAWGVYDMIGNVWEWTSTKETGGSGRVVRGGSFYNDDVDLRLSARRTYSPGWRNSGLGLRLLARIDL